MRKGFQALATAVHTLTVLPFPGGGAAAPAASFPFFPLVGLALGGVAAGIGWALGGRLGWEAGAAAAAVGALAGLTGGLHLDGLADTADGLAGGRTRERALEIMKDSRIGTMGAVALVLVLLLKTIALMRLVGLREWAWIPLPVMLARLAMVQLAVFQPYARAGGGTAERYVKDARPWHYGAALALALLLGAALAGPGAWVAAALAAGAGAWIGRRMTRRLGGVTGDVLGWAGEMVETALFFLLAAAGPWLHRVDWHALAR